MHNVNHSLLKLLSELQIVFKFKSLFLMGAGASAKYIPPTYKLYDQGKENLYKMLIPVPSGEMYLTNEQRLRFSILESPHKLYKTPEGKLLIDQTNIDFYDVVLHHYPEILELTCALTYSLDEYPRFCPEYQILNLATNDSLIANLNHDNLAEKFINVAKVISLHGTIPTKLKKDLSEILPYALNMDIRPFLKDVLLATQESEHLLLKNSNYSCFIKELESNQFQNIVIIGYSFFNKNGSDVYDVFTRDLIRSYIKDHFCNILIIDPNPEFVASVLNISIANCYHIYWDKFCHSFNFVQYFKKRRSWNMDLTKLRRFFKCYDRELYSCHGEHPKVVSYFTDRKSFLW